MNKKYNLKNYEKSRQLINKRLKSLRAKKYKIDEQINELILLRDFIRHNKPKDD